MFEFMPPDFWFDAGRKNIIMLFSTAAKMLRNHAK
jgi:hypothetical protein